MKTGSFLEVVDADPGEESPTAGAAADAGVVGVKFVLEAEDVDDPKTPAGGLLGESIFRKFESFLSLEDEKSHLLQ